MANVEIKTKTVTKIELEGVILTLSIREAIALQLVLSKTGGNPGDSLREEAQTVFEALENSGIKYRQASRMISGDLFCEDLTPENEKLLQEIEAEILHTVSISYFNTPELSNLLHQGKIIEWVKLFKELQKSGLKETKREYDRRRLLLDQY